MRVLEPAITMPIMTSLERRAIYMVVLKGVIGANQGIFDKCHSCQYRRWAPIRDAESLAWIIIRSVLSLDKRSTLHLVL